MWFLRSKRRYVRFRRLRNGLFRLGWRRVGLLRKIRTWNARPHVENLIVLHVIEDISLLTPLRVLGRGNHLAIG